MSSLYINYLFSNQLWYVSQFHISSWKPFKCKLTLKESCNTIENWVTKVIFSVIMCLQIQNVMSGVHPFWYLQWAIMWHVCFEIQPKHIWDSSFCGIFTGWFLDIAQKLPCYFNGFFGNSVISFKLFHKC